MGVAEEMCGRGQINFPADLPLVEDCQFQGLDPPLGQGGTGPPDFELGGPWGHSLMAINRASTGKKQLLVHC